jgi:phosphoribosylanthranilate isomerase
MTTLTVNIKDERKVQDVLRFLRDIDFLDVSSSVEKTKAKKSCSSIKLNTKGFRFNRDAANER